MHKILAIKASLNKGLPEKYATLYPEIKPVKRPEVILPENLDPN